MGLRDLIFRRKEPTKELTQLQMLKSTANVSTTIWSELHQSDLVQSAVRPYAKHVGRLIPRHVRNGESMPDPVIRKVLEHPNPMMTMQKLLEKTVISLKLDGNAYIYMQYESGVITGLYPLQPIATTALRDNSGNIYLRFDFSGDGKSRVIPYSHIIHLRGTFYEDDFFGDNPSVALKEIMETLGTTEQGMRYAIKNSAIIRWLLKFTNAMRPEDVKERTKEIRETFLDFDSDFGGVVGIDAKYDLKQVKNENTTYIPDNHVQKSLTKRVHDFFGVNDKIVDNTANEDEMNTWYSSEVSPIVQELSDEFTRKYFTLREEAHGNKIEFGSGSLVFASNKTKLGLIQLVDRGIMSLSEMRVILNMEPLKNDRFIVRREYGELDEVTGGGENNAENDSTEGQPQTVVRTEKSD
jgi:HK97 family phage portal protein